MRNLVRGTAALCGLLNVAALLAWVYGLGAFHVWFLLTGLPALVLLVGIGWWSARSAESDPHLRRALVAGTVGGLVGTVGYDVFRIPFVISGLKLFSPIDSYGVLLVDASSSSALTGFTGWAYHFTNGIGFGIAYAVVALGRRWPWAVVWGMVLETATIVSPFADSYGIRGKWDLIAIAYAAHLAYGVPLGIIVQRAASWDLNRPLVPPVSASLGALTVGLLLWLQPWTEGAAGTAAEVHDGRFHPEWHRLPAGGCLALRNADAVDYLLPDGKTLPSGGIAEVCPRGTGAHRVKLSDEPYSGGFVLVDLRS